MLLHFSFRKVATPVALCRCAGLARCQLSGSSRFISFPSAPPALRFSLSRARPAVVVVVVLLLRRETLFGRRRRRKRGKTRRTRRTRSNCQAHRTDLHRQLSYSYAFGARTLQNAGPRVSLLFLQSRASARTFPFFLFIPRRLVRVFARTAPDLSFLFFFF